MVHNMTLDRHNVDARIESKSIPTVNLALNGQNIYAFDRNAELASIIL